MSYEEGIGKYQGFFDKMEEKKIDSWEDFSAVTNVNPVQLEVMQFLTEHNNIEVEIRDYGKDSVSSDRIYKNNSKFDKIMSDYGLTNDEMNVTIQESHDYMINFGRKK